MTIEDFEDLIGRYGEDPIRWPADLRPAALRLVAESGAARTLLDEHRRIRAGLAVAPVERPSPDLLDRILGAAFDETPAEEAETPPTRRRRR